MVEKKKKRDWRGFRLRLPAVWSRWREARAAMQCTVFGPRGRRRALARTSSVHPGPGRGGGVSGLCVWWWALRGCLGGLSSPSAVHLVQAADLQPSKSYKSVYCVHTYSVHFSLLARPANAPGHTHHQRAACNNCRQHHASPPRLRMMQTLYSREGRAGCSARSA